MPAVTPNGKLILEDIDRLSKAPNGNGAIFSGEKPLPHSFFLILTVAVSAEQDRLPG